MDDVRDAYVVETQGSATDPFRIRRGHRRRDGLRVVIKTPRSKYPSATELAEIRHEHALLKQLEGAPVSRALGLVRIEHGVGLVLEDAALPSLQRLVQPGGVELGEFLRLARLATETLEIVHAHGIVHKDIKPEHFLYDAARERMVLIDFGIATTLKQEEQRPSRLDTLEGTLPYISPEQTGRMNRSVDRRSDLYSLGVVFYQLLTGVLPFETRDPLELVHCHIARFARQPAELRDVPRAVSDIVMRLLEKVAEQRYQTAAGLRADLARCEAELAASGTIVPFPLGEHDHSSELRVPQQLYGRKTDVALLYAALGRARAGGSELVLISGGAGIGKSALVHELYKELGFSGTFAAGKFDQFNRNVPYSGVARAAGELVRAELASPADRLAQWKADVLAAVANNGRLLTDIVAELELVIGPQPEVAALGPVEAQHRLEGLFQRFMQASASAEQPLVVFLDDLQWADPASLRLMRLMLQNPEQRHLLVVGSYRDNEVGALHPLTDFLAELAGSREIVRLSLGPLGKDHVEELLADTFPRRTEPIAPLADLVARKTGGNPFFISQFLDTAHKDGLIVFDPERCAWTWQLAAIDAAAVTSNVVDLVVAKLQRLDPETQATLRFAACVGHRFDCRYLAAISGRSAAVVAQSLWQALREGFVVALDRNYRLVSPEMDPESDWDVAYRFTHDRVQQAAYALIPEEERAPIHLCIGRQLLASAGTDGPNDDIIFDIVGALNLGRSHITDRGEQLRLAALEIRAAHRAKRASALSTACELSEVAIALLGEDPWQTDYDLVHAAHVIRAECAHLVGNAVAGLASIAELEQRGRTLVARVQAGNLHVRVLTHQGRLQEACVTSVAVLRSLGVEIPDPSDKAALGQAIEVAFGAYQAALAGRSIESLAEIPSMTEPEKLALIESLYVGIPAAFQCNTELMVLMVLMAVRQPLHHGTAPLSPFFYQQYAIVHTIVTGDHETAYRFGLLGIRLNTAPEYAAAVYFIFAAFNCHFRRPLSECLEYFRKGVQAALELGDQLHGAYCLTIGAAYRFYAGEPLERVAADIRGYVQALAAAKDVINLGFLEIVQETIRCLRGDTPRSDGFDPEAEQEMEAKAPPPITALYGASKAMLCYLAGDARAALEATERYRPAPVLLYNAEYSLYRGLALAELARQAEGDARIVLLDRLQKEIDVHGRWAASCPENFAHRHSLLRAELESVSGRGDSAMTLYERAITEASENAYPQHVALANELCARFHLVAGRGKVARSYFVDARYYYESWGAIAKADALTRQYFEGEPGARDSERASRNHVTATRAVPLGSGDAGLDLLSAMRATQAIASELVLERLLERLLRILLENAGAQQACLILREREGLRVTARLNVDPDRVEVGLAEALEASARVPATVIRYVARSKEPVVLDDARKAQRFARDEYLQRHGTRSLLCMPLLHQGELSAILYLENTAVAGAFTPARIQRLQFLGSHAAVAIENAKLYGQVQAATRRLEEANDTLEQKVRERTCELQGRNADMRRVLDNVAQALFSVDLQGRIASERSAAAERWFAELAPGESFAERMRLVDPVFAEWFACGFSMVAEDELPLDLAIDQLPQRLLRGEREYRASYSPVRDGERCTGLLIVIDDVTDAALLARAEADQKEQLALCQRLGQDRSGVVAFFEEGARIVEGLEHAGADAQVGEDAQSVERLLHTLKGNAGMLGFSLLAERCHAAEEAVAQGEAPVRAFAPVIERWRALVHARDLLMGKRTADSVEVARPALDDLLRRVRAGVSEAEIVAELESWRLEPMERPLQRLAEHATSLAMRLGKAGAAVVVRDGGVLADPRKSRALSAVLVHLVRNAVDHGFQTDLERAEQGKPPFNQLRLESRLDQHELVLEISDDGRGVDWTRVQKLGEARGLPNETREQLFQILCAPGVSTRSEVSDTSGRGVGLAAVVRDVEALGGRLALQSEPGHGSTWFIRVPAAALGALVFESSGSQRRLRCSVPPGPAASAS